MNILVAYLCHYVFDLLLMLYFKTMYTCHVLDESKYIISFNSENHVVAWY
jgi:hypothetical protein